MSQLIKINLHQPMHFQLSKYLCLGIKIRIMLDRKIMKKHWRQQGQKIYYLQLVIRIFHIVELRIKIRQVRCHFFQSCRKHRIIILSIVKKFLRGKEPILTHSKELPLRNQKHNFSMQNNSNLSRMKLPITKFLSMIPLKTKRFVSNSKESILNYPH